MNKIKSFITKKILVSKEDFEGRGWIYQSLGWGLSMYILMNIFIAWMTDDISLKRLVWGVPIYLIGGLLYGLTMKTMYRHMD